MNQDIESYYKHVVTKLVEVQQIMHEARAALGSDDFKILAQKCADFTDTLQ
jgi:hypothetical protein